MEGQNHPMKKAFGRQSAASVMKRAGPWVQDTSSSDSSGSDSEDDCSAGKKLNTKVEPGKKKRGVLDYNALSRHGYKGGLSVLKVPPPKVVDDNKQDWSWSTGKRENVDAETIEEPYEERERTRAVANMTEKPPTAPKSLQTEREKKNISFSQKEKRKRDLGQASRGKNYVEEEKRLLRESGVYSGFDS